MHDELLYNKSVARVVCDSCDSFIQQDKSKRGATCRCREGAVCRRVVIDTAVARLRDSPPDVLALAKLVDTLPGLKLRGLLAYDGGAQHVNGFAARKERALKAMEDAARVHAGMKAAGLNTEIFSGGGTGTYSVQHLTPGFTDVQVGSYIFMDMQLPRHRQRDGRRSTRLRSSLTVMATVVNNRFPGRLTTMRGPRR